MGRVKQIAIIADCDFVSEPLGGVVSLLNNMLSVSVSTNDIEYSLIGVSFSPEDDEGKWALKQIGGNLYNWMPVFVSKIKKDKTRYPIRFRLIEGLSRYKKTIDFQKFDALYIHTPEIMLALGSVSQPIIYHIHGDPMIAIRGSRFPLLRAPIFTSTYRKIISRTLNRSAGIIWAAEEARKRYYRDLGISNCKKWDSKSKVIYSSVDPMVLPDVKTKSMLDRTASAKKCLVTVSRLSEVKHIDFLIDVFAHLKNQGIVDCFSICGDGEERTHLEKKVAEMGLSRDVVFHGMLNKEELGLVLNESDLFVFASESEAMSLVVLESMAVGVPVVSTDVGDLKFVVTEKTGAIVERRDCEAYSAAVEKCIKHGKSFYKDECKKVASEFTPDRMRLDIDSFIVQCLMRGSL